jgi:octopine/nopaline transport system permease protein
MPYFQLMGFGPLGWGLPMLIAAAMTFAVAIAAMMVGAVFGAIGAAAKLSSSTVARGIADAYTTILRGVPDLLVIYLFYFGGSAALTAVGHYLGAEGFVGLPTFLTGALAVGIVSGAYQTEVIRAAYLAVPKGEIEAAKAFGMSRWLLSRRIVLPQVIRFALPGMGNVWQAVLKETALISVTGLIELLRESQIGAGSTRQPFAFYMTAAAIYLVFTAVSTWAFNRVEVRALRGVRASA